MGELVPTGGSRIARAEPAVGRVTHINTFDDLTAGTYWRAKDDVPALTKPEKRQRGVYLPEDHPDYIKGSGWGAGERNRIGTEDYLVDVPIRSAMPAGRMHLVSSLKLVDGDVHAVVLQGHPSEGEKSARTYLVDEFLHYFELVPEDEAKAIRDAEVAAIQQEIVDLQQAMISGPPPEAPVALIGHQAALPDRLPENLPPKPTVGAMIANIGSIERLRETAERAVAIAERQSSWITTHTTQIGEKTAALVPFFRERAAAALASTESVMRYATDLQRGVQSLGLYTGKDVEVRKLSDGEDAPAGEPLRFYRDMLYLDEEYVVRLDAEDAASAGADHTDFDDFIKTLVKDETLRDRIFPHPRMVVLMRYRRTAKKYFDGDDMATALANAEKNRPNGAQFLLIRNGDKLYQVWSELTTQAIVALFPNQRMGDAPFKGVRGETIKLDDLNLSEAKGKLDDLNRVYKNLLILLWGLHDRGDVDFGPFYAPSDWTPQGFIDEGFQQRNMRFWDPYGDQAMLGTGRPRFQDWVREKNGWLRSGSRVLVTEGALRGFKGYAGSKPEREQPDAVRRVREGDGFAYEFVVRKTKRGHVMSVEAGRDVYPRERGRRAYYLKQRFDVPLDETNDGYSEGGTLRWLCLDMVERADIDHYMQSRLDRPSYMEHYHMLKAARAQLVADEELLEPLVARLEGAFEENGVAVPAGTTARETARHAIRLWRAANRGTMPPVPGGEGFAAAYKTLLGSMWTLAGNDRPVAPAEELAAAEGRKPLRLALTGKDRFALYATSVGDEIEDTLFDHVWVTRIACQRKAGRLVPTSRSIVPMPGGVADEEVLHEWDALADWRGRDVPEILNRSPYYDTEVSQYDYASIRKALAAARSGTLTTFVEETQPLAVRLADLNDKRRRKGAKSRMVAQMEHVQPFAIIRTSGFQRRAVEGFTSRYELDRQDTGFMVLALQDCPFRMAYRQAGADEERAAVARSYASQYERKDTNRAEFLASVDKAPRIGATRLADWATDGGDPDLRSRDWRGIELQANWAEAVRQFDVQSKPYADDLWVPTLPDMLVWMDPAAPAILNDLCARFGWEAVPFVPSKH